MNSNSECGDRRCTLEEANRIYTGYVHDYTARIKHLTKEEIDRMHPRMTRIKTELDEAGELLEKAKEKGAEAWDSFKDGVQNALDHLEKNLKESGHEPR